MTLREYILKESLVDNYKQKYYNKKITKLDAEEKEAKENILRSRVLHYKNILDKANDFNESIAYINSIIDKFKKVDIKVDEETLNKLNSINIENSGKLQDAIKFISRFVNYFDVYRDAEVNSYLDNLEWNKKNYKSKLDKIENK